MKAIHLPIAIASLLFAMIGADKFLNFLEPPCSLSEAIPYWLWMFFGVLQLAAAVLIWLPGYRRAVALFFMLFMAFFTLVHLSQGQTDIGGSSFMAVLLALIAWNPRFLGGR